MDLCVFMQFTPVFLLGVHLCSYTHGRVLFFGVRNVCHVCVHWDPLYSTRVMIPPLSGFSFDSPYGTYLLHKIHPYKMSVVEKPERLFVRGSLYGMALCNALIPHKPKSGGKFGTETSITICMAQAIIEDGGYQHDKFTYIKKLLEWFRGDNLNARSDYVRRSVALALNAWDRQLAVTSAGGNVSKENEHWEMRKNRFDEMQRLIDDEFVVDVGCVMPSRNTNINPYLDRSINGMVQISPVPYQLAYTMILRTVTMNHICEFGLCNSPL